MTVAVEVHLPANGREALAELAERVDDPVDECLLEVAFLRVAVAVECKEVQDVRVLRELLRHVRVARREDIGEVRRRRPAVACVRQTGCGARAPSSTSRARLRSRPNSHGGRGRRAGPGGR